MTLETIRIHSMGIYGCHSFELDRMFKRWCTAHDRAMDIAADDMEHPVWAEVEVQWQMYEDHEREWREAYEADVMDTQMSLLEAAGRF